MNVHVKIRLDASISSHLYQINIHSEIVTWSKAVLGPFPITITSASRTRVSGPDDLITDAFSASCEGIYRCC